MTKLEQKLIELGYKKSKTINFEYTKNNKSIFLCNYNKEVDFIRINTRKFKRNEVFDILNIKINEMQKDLAILKEVEQCEKN